MRRAAIACLAAVLLPAIVSAALLGRAQLDKRQEAQQTSQAEDARNAAQQQLNGLEVDVRNAQENLSSSAGSSFSSSAEIDELRKSVEYARQQATAAATRLQRAQDSYASAVTNELDAKRRSGETWGRWLLYVGFVVALVLAAVLTFGYVRSEKRRAYENRSILDGLASVGTSADPTSADARDLAALWGANKDQLQGYHQLVLNYASSTRQTTQITLLAGFGFLIVVGVFALLARDLAPAIASSVVAGTGAVVTGFIAQAVLRNADTSSREVLEFFSHPIEVERMLAAE